MSSLLVSELNSFAGGKGDNVVAQNYSGVIKKEKQNTWLDYAYRDTTKASTPFRVRLDSSTEGAKTVTSFWLEDEKETNLCTVLNVTQGEGYYSQNTYQEACKKKVYLTAENNNYNSTTYKISGKWKEE